MVLASVEAVNAAFSRRLRLNQAILKNAYLRYPVEGGHEEYVQLGRGQVSSPEWCAKHTSFFVCRHKDVHAGVVYGGVDFSGKDVVTHGHLWCHNPQCPKCFLGGWGMRQARAIVAKMDAGVARGFGEVEHFTVSFPREYWDLPMSVLRKMAEGGCLRRGFLGAALIPHGRRINRKCKTLKWGPHFHGLGFIRGGYDVCRGCSSFVSRVDCFSCTSFDGRTRRENEKDHLIVRVFEKRKTVLGTATYQLSHATMKVGVRSEHIVTYFGVLANKSIKSFKPEVVRACAVCASVGVRNVMSRCYRWGKDFIATDVGDPSYMNVFPSEEFDSSGLPNFVDAGGGRVE